MIRDDLFFWVSVLAQIEQMTLEQIGVFQGRVLADIAKGRIASREASALDRAFRKRLKVIEQEIAPRLASC
jgi:hypothetical protein